MAASSSYQLAGVVDEDPEAEAPPAKKTKPLDWDNVFAYKTFKIIRIKDRYLGMLYWFIVTLVILYILFFALQKERKHEKQEDGIGTVITKFSGKTFDQNNKPFDEADLRFPEVEPFGAFIMTKSVTQKAQIVDECIDYDFPCATGVDGLSEKQQQVVCTGVGGTCENGFCKHSAWCPSLGTSNAGNSATVQRTSIENLGDTIVEMLASISYPGLGQNMFVAGGSEGAINPYRNITVDELIASIEPKVELSDLVEEGALIGVSFIWKCDVTLPDCEPELINVKRLDSGTGFVQKRSRKYRISGQLYRDASVMYGIRLLVDSTGRGGEVNLVLLVIQLGSCLALLRTATIMADFLMLQAYPTHKAEMYYQCKVTETKDYSDLQDRLNLIQEKAPEVQNLLSKSKFGLGPGGRGGMASVVLRSRPQ